MVLIFLVPDYYFLTHLNLNSIFQRKSFHFLWILSGSLTTSRVDESPLRLVGADLARLTRLARPRRPSEPTDKRLETNLMTQSWAGGGGSLAHSISHLNPLPRDTNLWIHGGLCRRLPCPALSVLVSTSLHQSWCAILPQQLTHSINSYCVAKMHFYDETF